jgi:hypothetical protein
VILRKMASHCARLHIRRTVSANEPSQNDRPLGPYQRRYATINSASQTSAMRVGLTMDARSSVPGLDTPQTRQRFAPGLTSAPQRLQGKARTTVVSPRPVFYREQFAEGVISGERADWGNGNQIAALHEASTLAVLLLLAVVNGPQFKLARSYGVTLVADLRAE